MQLLPLLLQLLLPQKLLLRSEVARGPAGREVAHLSYRGEGDAYPTVIATHGWRQSTPPHGLPRLVPSQNLQPPQLPLLLSGCCGTAVAVLRLLRRQPKRDVPSPCCGLHCRLLHRRRHQR